MSVSVLGAFADRAATTPAATAFVWDGVPIAYGELWSRVEAFARRLRGEGAGSGARIVLVLPNGPDFLVAFYAAQRAGASPVPLAPASGSERVRSIADGCRARLVVGEPGSRARVPRATVCVGDAGPEAPLPPLGDIGADDVGFIQYTSGSTGEPKGVPLTHANLETNVAQIVAGMEITERDVFVSWLPVYHDMGLILKTMCPIVVGAPAVLLPTALGDTRPWLQAIADHRATFTAAPDFAYRLCVRHAARGRFDLRSLRVALNAAEPVRASTVEAFERTFGLRDVMTAGYGLAEATVGVSMSLPGERVRVDERGVVSVGPPFPGIDVWAVEGARTLGRGEVGEIVVRGTANTAGYLDDPDATAALFWNPGVIRTGDVGYVGGDGELRIVGRRKNVIKRAGETIAPREVEEVVDEVPGIRYAAAIGVELGRPATEHVVVLAEVREPDLADGEGNGIATACVRAIHDRLGFRPGRVHLLRPRTIPLTHNGKIRYAELREWYRSGDLRTGILFP